MKGTEGYGGTGSQTEQRSQRRQRSADGAGRSWSRATRARGPRADCPEINSPFTPLAPFLRLKIRYLRPLCELLAVNSRRAASTSAPTPGCDCSCMSEIVVPRWCRFCSRVRRSLCFGAEHERPPINRELSPDTRNGKLHPRYALWTAAAGEKPDLRDGRGPVACPWHWRERRDLPPLRRADAAQPCRGQSARAGRRAPERSAGVRLVRRQQRQRHLSVVGADPRQPARVLRHLRVGRRPVRRGPRGCVTPGARALGER